jgi:putative ABC transport system ATP-binding protein
MSGGEQQRVAIGRALVTDPAVVLADEPTGNLDSANSQAVCELLRELSTTHGKTIVMVTHEASVAAYAQQVVVLKDGKIIDRFDTTGAGAGAEGLAIRYQEAAGQKCGACGSPVPAGSRFCPGCGKPVEAARSTGFQPLS